MFFFSCFFLSSYDTQAIMLLRFNGIFQFEEVITLNLLRLNIISKCLYLDFSRATWRLT